MTLDTEHFHHVVIRQRSGVQCLYASILRQAIFNTAGGLYRHKEGNLDISKGSKHSISWQSYCEVNQPEFQGYSDGCLVIPRSGSGDAWVPGYNAVIEQYTVTNCRYIELDYLEGHGDGRADLSIDGNIVAKNSSYSGALDPSTSHTIAMKAHENDTHHAYYRGFKFYFNE